MDLNQAGAPQGRNSSFQDGQNGTPGAVASSLNEDSAVFNSQVPGQFTPRSVLAGLPGMSGNGMSEDDKSRLMPGGSQLPSSNGIGQGNYEAAMRMRLLGNRGEM